MARTDTKIEIEITGKITDACAHRALVLLNWYLQDNPMEKPIVNKIGGDTGYYRITICQKGSDRPSV